MDGRLRGVLSRVVAQEEITQEGPDTVGKERKEKEEVQECAMM